MVPAMPVSGNVRRSIVQAGSSLYIVRARLTAKKPLNILFRMRLSQNRKRMTVCVVIPAKAGIPFRCSLLLIAKRPQQGNWIPAFAGMTTKN
jgi:hypothetical protein